MSLVSAVLAISAPLLGQPPNRYAHAMAFSSVNGRIISFGGVLLSGTPGGTWEWDGAAWVRSQANGPLDRPDIAMSMHGNSVMFFGGYNGSSDTWLWSGTSWNLASLLSSPSGRAAHAMAHDSQGAVTVLFGGVSAGNQLLGDTWLYDGTWRLAATTGPAPRGGHALAYDSTRNRVVLFGGYFSSATLSDTWEWDGLAWSQRAPGPPRSMHSMAFDSHRGRAVFFGGMTNSGPAPAETWEWDGVSWTLASTTGPASRWLYAMAFDGARSRTVLCGGLTSSTTELPGYTWEWDGNTWIGVPGGPQPVTASVTLFGQGCPGPTGSAAQLASAPGSTPIIGTTLQMTLTGLPANIFSIPFGAMGFSDQTFSGAALPASLAAIGAPGCTLYVSIDQEYVLANQSGTASWNIPVPYDQSLLGLDAYVQCGILAPGFNAANLVVSNAGHIVVGSM